MVKSTQEQQLEDFNIRMASLHKRVDKAENDRMKKYYGQISELNDWVVSVKQKVEKNAQISEAISNYFQYEHQIFTLNLVAETLAKCLDGKELNKMIDDMHER